MSRNGNCWDNAVAKAAIVISSCSFLRHFFTAIKFTAVKE